MRFLDKIFKSPPKKKQAACSICKSIMNQNDGFALSTAQVVSSRKYWDRKMVEPETLSYTTAHFKNQDQRATMMRKIIFEKTAGKEIVWMTCESCIDHFEVCQDETKQLAAQWWQNDTGFVLPNKGKAEDNMSSEDFEEIKSYATMEAGSSFVRR
ncbi:hypothetical protein N6H18_17540 [Reichenbachiella agarivorans]|uniref:Uncharacterized protein n=1 Tax=Reichenbachiella agarivorans TaxID=2979464 RepID=A0ABY6CNQ3_9BACT|nr:hypothetical protein [Reichenbachiella agarivorans]UXP32148.1 hypothetical protein N6H18_17540 [Reichenbachiella agarivorans]